MRTKRTQARREIRRSNIRRRRADQRRLGEARTEAGLEYNPSLRAARAEAKGSAKREKQIGQWYGQLANDYQQGAQTAQQAFATAEQATNARLAEAGQRNTAALDEQSAKDASFAKLVGGPTDASGLSQAAAAAAALERQGATLAAPLTAIRANTTAFLGTRAASARMRGIEARKTEGDRRQKIVSDISAGRREKGQATTAALSKLTRADREAGNERRALGVKAGYNKALTTQAKLGYAGKKVSAGAQVQAASIYSTAKERGADVQKEVARLQKEGKYRTAEALENQAKTYGEDSGGGYNTREAGALLSSAGKNFKTPEAAVNYLVNRGVKLDVARKAVHRALGGGQQAAPGQHPSP